MTRVPETGVGDARARIGGGPSKGVLPSMPRRLLALFALLIVGIAGAGTAYFSWQRQRLVAETFQSLSLVADLRVEQIASWRQAIFNDALRSLHNPLLLKALERWEAGRREDAALRQDILLWIQNLHHQRDYAGIFLLDPEGKVLLESADEGEGNGALEGADDLMAQAAQGNVIESTDLIRDADGFIHFELLVPLRSGGAPGGRLLGFLVLDVEPAHYLFPVLQSWPTASASAETLLVRRDGEEVLFLNELRHRKGTALTLRMPLSQRELPAARVASGFEGAFRGKDYRGVPVLAAVRRVPDSGWSVVAKVDVREVFAPQRERAVLLAALVLAMVGAVAFGVVAAWRKGAASFYRERQAALQEAHDQLEQRVLERTAEARGERQRLFDVLEMLPAYVILLTEDYHVAFDNRFFRERFGEHLGRRCHEYLFGREAPCENCESFKVFEKDGPHHWEWTGPDGRIYDIHDFLFTGAAGDRMVLEMGIDITERKRAEAELIKHRDHLEELVRDRTRDLEELNAQMRAILDHLSEGVVVADLTGKLFHWNPAAVAMHGFSTLEECQRSLPEFSTIFELSTPEEGLLPLDRWPLARVLSGETLLGWEVELRRKGSDWRRVFSYGGTLATDQQGHPLMAVISTTDITGRKAAEQALDRAYGDLELKVAQRTQELKDANERLQKEMREHQAADEALERTQKELADSRRLSDIGSLAATVAHELRNPLGVIKAAAFNLRRKNSDPAIESHFEHIDNKIEESSRIIDNLLFYTRLKKPRYERVRIARIVEECVASAAERHPEALVAVEARLDGILDVEIDADAGQLKEVFGNIIENAYESRHDGEGRIQVEGSLAEGRSVQIRISDNGEGIDPEDLGRVFEPFFTRKVKGTGLGLAICRELVYLHHGTIEVESRKGEGTQMLVTIPLRVERHA